MSQIDTENDPFLALLTDALRAGPGSPQWREALSQLPADGQDEYRKLIEAREALESGREYRSVRPGPGFTRKVMNGLEAQTPAGTPKVRIATMIAALSAVVLLVLIGLAVYAFYPRSAHEESAQALNELASTFLPAELTSSNFNQTVVPDGWREIGSLPIVTASGLKAGDATVPPDDYAGGGIVLASSVPAEKPVAIQAVIKVDKAGDDLIPQVFASADSNFSSDRATSSQEVVWQLQGAKQKAVVDGKVVLESSLEAKSPHTVRLVLKGDLAVLESDGKRIWAGHSLLGDKPRYLGVRFIKTGQPSGADITVQSVKVTTANQ